MVELRNFTGPDVTPHIPDLARLRITVFREYPYLYDGDLDYERDYLQTYAASPASLFVLAFHGDRVVGGATGVPMADEEDSFKAPLLAHGYDPEAIFYFGESVLEKPYRGQGIGHAFFDRREAHAAALPGITTTCFCAVERPADHPLKPPDHRPLDPFWRKRGYVKHPELQTTYTWKQINENEPTPKTMTFWLRTMP